MIPLVSTVKELTIQRAVIEDVADRVLGAWEKKSRISSGTMIELPRAAAHGGTDRAVSRVSSSFGQ